VLLDRPAGGHDDKPARRIGDSLPGERLTHPRIPRHEREYPGIECSA
jgi:hypothetical protein